MELTIALAITILNCVLGVITFASNKKKEALQNAKENHQELIEYQLNELKNDVKQILKNMGTYREEMTEKAKEIVKNEIEKHILEYHNIKREGK